jgi:chromate transporter
MNRPSSPAQLFAVFNRLALRGFGGVLPWAQRTLVEEEQWFTREQFVEMLTLAQVLPGPNIANVSLMVGDRFFGIRGALAALGGLLAVPLAIVMTLALAYGSFGTHPMVVAALRGMSAVSAGLVIAMAGKLLPTQRRNLPGWCFVAAAFAMVGPLHWPLHWVMLGLGASSVAIARARAGKRA